MPLISAIAMYFLIWWTMLFVVLPLEVRNHHELKEQNPDHDEFVKGTDKGAPVKPNMRRKVWQTSILSAGVWLVLFVAFQFDLIDWRNLPFFPDFTPEGFE